MSKRDDIKKQLIQQQNDVYGEGTVSGSAPDPEADDNVADTLSKTVGADIKPGDEFYLADEVMKDEKDRLPGSFSDEEEEEAEDELLDEFEDLDDNNDLGDEDE